MKHRTTAFLATLALALAPATAAFAKPVSTYSIDVSWDTVSSASISQTEGGAGTFSLTHNDFSTTTCADGSTGLVANSWSASDAPATVTLVTDRKMDTATATATGLATLVSEVRCLSGVTTTTSQVTIDLVFDATATGSTDRFHLANGDRVISRSADVVVTFDGVTALTGGHIVETISK